MDDLGGAPFSETPIFYYASCHGCESLWLDMSCEFFYLWLKAGHMPGEAEIIDFPTSSDAFHEGRSRCATLWLLSCLVFSSCRIQLHFASLSSFGLCTTPLAIAEVKWWTCWMSTALTMTPSTFYQMRMYDRDWKCIQIGQRIPSSIPGGS